MRNNLLFTLLFFILKGSICYGQKPDIFYLNGPFKVFSFETLSTDVFQPSGLAAYQGIFYAVSDKDIYHPESGVDEAAIYQLRLDNNYAEVIRVCNITLDKGIELPKDKKGSPKKGFDWEAINIDPVTGKIYILSETNGNIYVAAKTTEIFKPINKDKSFFNEFQKANKNFLSGSTNAGLEGMFRFTDGRILLVAERSPRGFMIFDRDYKPTPYYWIDERSVKEIEYSTTSENRLNVPEAVPDFSDAFIEGGNIFLLSRFQEGIYVVPMTKANLETHTFKDLTGVQFWSFTRAMAKYQFGGQSTCKNGKCPYGTAEGLYIDQKSIYIILDNNGWSKNGANGGSTKTLLLKFDRSKVDSTLEVPLMDFDETFKLGNKGEKTNAVDNKTDCNCCAKISDANNQPVIIDATTQTGHSSSGGKCKAKQKSKETNQSSLYWTLQFDKDGKLLSGMPDYVKKKDQFDFDLSSINLDQQPNAVLKQMDSIVKALQTQCSNDLEKSECCFADYSALLNSYLSGSKIVCGQCDDWNSYIPSIGKDTLTQIKHDKFIPTGNYLKKIDRDIFDQAVDIAEKKYDKCIDGTWNVTYPLVDTSKYIYSGTWLDFSVNRIEIHRQYAIKLTKKGSDEIDILITKQDIGKLSIPSLDKSVDITISRKGKVLATSNLTPDKLQHFSVSDFLKANLKKKAQPEPLSRSGYQLSYVIKAPNVKNTIIDAYLKYLKKNLIAYYPYDKIITNSALNNLKSRMDSMYIRILHYNIASKITGCDTCISPKTDNELCKDIQSFMVTNSSYLAAANEAICKNRLWLRATAWISGKVLMNPFGVSDTTGLSADIKTIQTQLSNQQSLLTILNTRIQTGIRDQAAEINLLLDKRETVEKQVNTFQDQLNKLQSQIKKASPADGFSNSSKIYYSGHMLISSARSIYLARPHNAANNLQFDENWMPFSQDRYEKAEHVKYHVYNIPSGNKVKVSSSVSVIPDDVNIIEDAFSTSTGNTQKLNNVNQYLNEEVNLSGGDECGAAIKCFMNYYGEVSWLNSQTVPVHTTALPGGKEGPSYTDTIIEPNSQKKSPALVTYNIKLQPTKGDTLRSDTFSFKIYKKQYIQLTFGVGYVPGTSPNLGSGRYTSFYNGATNTFSNSYLSPVDIIYGIKIFPFGMDVRRWWPSLRDGRYGHMLVKRGDHIVNRLYILGAASLSQKQLFNFYVGVGMDVIPGLGISTGCNVYNTNQYYFQNNQVVGSFQTPAYTPYFAITVDPVVFMQLSNLFSFKY